MFQIQMWLASRDQRSDENCVADVLLSWVERQRDCYLQLTVRRPALLGTLHNVVFERRDHLLLLVADVLSFIDDCLRYPSARDNVINQGREEALTLAVFKRDATAQELALLTAIPDPAVPFKYHVFWTCSAEKSYHSLVLRLEPLSTLRASSLAAIATVTLANIRMFPRLAELQFVGLAKHTAADAPGNEL